MRPPLIKYCNRPCIYVAHVYVCVYGINDDNRSVHAIRAFYCLLLVLPLLYSNSDHSPAYGSSNIYIIRA